jgi:aminoglycoside N3'-acetyltransferase
LTWPELFDRLRVPEGGVVYVQSSADWIERAGFRAADAVGALRAWIGDRGTVVMPAYPCRTSHLEYLQGHPIYDVRRTPAGVGLIAELFRRTPGTVRSLDPDFCVAALGAEAAGVAATDLEEPDPFGARSIYVRMIERKTTLVGLGVSLNTNSFIHVVDSHFQAQYPRPVYESQPYSVEVIDSDGQRHHVWRRAVRPEFQQRTRPAAIADALRGNAAFRHLEIDGTQFLAWDLEPWRDWCVAHAEHELMAGRAPCWLTQIW